MDYYRFWCGSWPTPKSHIDDFKKFLVKHKAEDALDRSSCPHGIFLEFCEVYLRRKDTEFFCLLSTSDFGKLIPDKGSEFLSKSKDECLKAMLSRLDMTSCLYRHQLFALDRIHPSLKFACIGYTSELQKQIEGWISIGGIAGMIVMYV